MTPENYHKRTTDSIQLRLNFFDEAIGKSQTGMYRAILSATREFDLDKAGNIKATQKNIKTLTRLRSELESLVITDTYVDRVNKFTDGFQELKGISDTYYRAISATFQPNKAIYETITSLAIEDTAASLLQSGINEKVIEPIQKILTDSVLNGWSFDDVVENLRVQILGSDERLGALERYVKQIANDSLNQYNASYDYRISEDLNLKWYLYIGAIKTTTRSYCQTRANKYWHIKEIQKLPAQWDGMIVGTNKSNILIYRGGYNCGHKYIPVMQEVVPDKDVERVRQLGYLD